MKKVFETVVRILCDIRPDKIVDGAYLFAQTKDNERSVFTAAQNITNDFLARRIMLLDKSASNGFGGFKAWKRQLLGAGIKEEMIAGVTLENSVEHNTLTESRAVIRFAKINNFKTIIVTAASFHQVRAFMTVVKVALEEYPDLRIFSHPGVALPWNEKVAHSQGALRARRLEFNESELKRIKKYHRKGDLCSFETVIEYLDKRDGMSSI